MPFVIARLEDWETIHNFLRYRLRWAEFASFYEPFRSLLNRLT
ncbi:hypothetical protein [Bacillus xiapuensis]|nr:hypothetical protein [Bacillus xiapuensis]